MTVLFHSRILTKGTNHIFVWHSGIGPLRLQFLREREYTDVRYPRDSSK